MQSINVPAILSDIKSADTQVALQAGEQLTAQSRWYADLPEHRTRLPQAWQPWLFDRGSLTTLLTQFANGDFKVKVLRQAWRRTDYREAAKLGAQADCLAYIREVQLLCNSEVMVYARSVIPAKLFHAEQYTFANMGSRPLGDLLFKDGHMHAAKRDIVVCELADEPVYGRVTPYQYHADEILVSEYFVNQKLITP